MTEAKGDGGEGLYVRGRSGQRDMEQGTDSAWSKSQKRSSRLRCYICQSEEHLKSDCPRYNHKKSQGFVMNEDQRSTQQCTNSGMPKYLGVALIQQQNGLVKEMNVTLLAKVVLYMNMGFNESGEQKKSFIGSGVGTGSLQLLQRVKFEVEPQEDHTFEVEPHGNVDHVVGSQEVGLKDDMDARSDMYVLSNGCKNVVTIAMTVTGSIHLATKGLLDKAKGNVLGMEIVRDQSGFTIKSWYRLCLRDTPYCRWRVVYQETMMWKRMTDVQVFVDFGYTMRRSITVMGRSITSGVYDTYGGCRGGYLAKRTRNRVRILAKDSSGYCYRCLVKGYPWYEVPA
nr:zinc finger, CCHC-type [Tanacetum cinerariifolium]